MFERCQLVWPVIQVDIFYPYAASTTARSIFGDIILAFFKPCSFQFTGF